MNLLPRAAFVAFSALAVSLAGLRVAVAQVDPNSGADFITIGAPGNIAYNRDDPFDRVAGRGSVGYEYRMAKMEVTSAQWLEFLNACFARTDQFIINTPISWGGELDPNYSGPGQRFRLRNVADAGMLPVGGIAWREAAYYCNWLHNDKSPARTSFENGAYDASTFNGTGFPTWTDQPTRHPDARYFIPTWDEWLKAVHYDPNRNNGDGTTGGWWLQPNGTDIPLTYGLPPSFGGSPLNQSNAGVNTGQGIEFLVPLGAYANVVTPWGLLDASGGSSEWTEGIFADVFSKTRIYEGGARGASGFPETDFSYSNGADFPGNRSISYGLRIASPVPSSPVAITMGMVLGFFAVRRRRTSPCTHQPSRQFCS